MVETKQKKRCSPFYLLLQEAWLCPPLPQTWVANVATTCSLRPHGSGLQHNVHTSGQVFWTAEQRKLRSYRSRQLYDSVSRHLSRRQHTHEHTKREQLLFCVCPGAVLCALFVPTDSTNAGHIASASCVHWARTSGRSTASAASRISSGMQVRQLKVLFCPLVTPALQKTQV